MKYTFLAAAAVFATLFTGVDADTGGIGVARDATAQQMGSQPWGFPARSRSLAAQFQFQREYTGGGSASSADGLAALHQYVTQYNSSSTSIANMNQVNQNLSDGSSGSVGQSTEQTSSGNQSSDAETETTVNNTAVTAEGEGSTAQNAGETNTSQTQTASQSESGGQQTSGQ